MQNLATTFRLVLEKASSILLNSDSNIEFFEAQASLMDVVWGVWLVAFNPFTPWFAKPSSYALLILLTVLPRWLWATIFIVVGVGHFTALSRGGLRWRSTFTFVEVVMWLYITSYIGLEDPNLVLFPITFLFFLGALWGYLRLRQEIQTRG